MHALRAALTGLVDYAGLFPPAGLDLATTVASHDRYARSPDRWMLGRLVVPIASLGQIAALLERDPASARDWTISALLTPNDAPETVAAAIERFHGSHSCGAGTSVPADSRPMTLRSRGAPSQPVSRVTVSALEATVRDTGSLSGVRALAARGLECFVEVPLDDRRDAWLDAIATAGCRAKVRTGGTTADRFPSPAALAACLRACASRGLALKATAGLHHPIRNAYRLTYAPDSPSGVMHGFVNLLVAALVLRAGGSEGDAVRALETTDPREFVITEHALRWMGLTFDEGACADTRGHLLRSVGSCSFEEPVAELRALGWWTG